MDEKLSPVLGHLTVTREEVLIDYVHCEEDGLAFPFYATTSIQKRIVNESVGLQQLRVRRYVLRAYRELAQGRCSRIALEQAIRQVLFPVFDLTLGLISLV